MESTPNGTLFRARDVIEALAKRFPQLYVAPAEGAQELHSRASRTGAVMPGANLDHFASSPEDELREVDTPAGPVEVAFLKNRADFETLLQIISHKSQPVGIDRTVGAITYRGLADWGKVAKAHEDYLASGGTDWPSEFARLAKTPGAFRSELIVISEGPYSNISANETPYAEDEWVRVSREIRLHHECAHVVCRRMMPQDVLPVWDEITADVTGLLCAMGRYESALAAKILGVTKSGFAGGRLTEYISDEQAAHIDELSVEITKALEQIQDRTEAAEVEPFEFLLTLKKSPLIGY